MGGDPLALDEDLHGARGETHLDFGAREAVGDAVEVASDIDVIVDADPAQAPFGKHVRLDRQRLERWSVELFQELPAGAPETADRPLLVEPQKQFADCRVQFGEAMEHTIAQTADEPALDDKHTTFHLGLGESCQMQVVWERRRPERFGLRTLFIPFMAARSN